DWIEETEQLITVGVAGIDRFEVGGLVETAFKKYNAAKASEENNRPDSYVRQQPEGPAAHERDDMMGGRGRGGQGGGGNAMGLGGGLGGGDDMDDGRSHGSGNAIVRLNG